MADEIQTNEWTQLNPTTTPSYRFFPAFIETEFVNIDNQRNITNVNQTNQIADNHSQFIGFEMPRYFDHVDMSKMNIKIHYVTPYDINAVVDAINVSYNNTTLRFGWLLDTTITAYPGITKFEIQAFGTVEDSEGNKVDYVWKSKPNGTINVEKSLDSASVAVTPPDTPFEQAIVELNSIKSQAEQARDRAVEAANSADNAFTEKLNEAVSNVNELKQLIDERTGVSTLDMKYDEKAGTLSLYDTTISKTDPFKVIEGIESIKNISATRQVNVETGETTISFYKSVYTTPENLITSVTFSTNPTTEWRNKVLNDASSSAKELLATYHEESILPIGETLKSHTASIEELKNNASKQGISKTIVDVLPTEHINMETIYFVPVENATDKHLFDTWIYVKYNDNGVEKYAWNQIGSSVDSSQYYSKAEIDALLANLSNGGEGISASDVDKLISKNSRINAMLHDITENQENIGKTNQTVSALKTIVDRLNETSQKYRYQITYGDTSASPNIPQFEGDAEDEDRRNHRLTLWEIENMDTPEETWVAAGTTIITGGGGNGQNEGTSSIIITRTDDCPSPFVILYGQKVVLKFNYSDKDTSGQSVDAKGVIKVGTRIIKSVDLYEGVNEIDITKFMQIGSQKVTLVATDDNGTVASRSWTVRIVDIGITSSFDDTLPRSEKSVSFSYTPNGSIEKEVHFIYDGEVLPSVTTEVSGSLMSYPLPEKPYGSHLLEAWISAKVGGTEIETEHIFKDILIYREGSSHPVIGCRTQKIQMTQYGRKNIEFVVYDPSTETPTVHIAIDGEIATTLQMDSNKGTYQFTSEVIGEHILTLGCGDTVKHIYITVKDMGVKIEPVMSDLVFDFNPVGRSNSSVHDRAWSYNGIKMTVSDNFDWQNGGYQVDTNGDQYFLVKAGTRAVIDYKMFQGEQTVNGKEFKLVFKTTNVQKSNATFLSCMQGEVTPIGLKMDVHNAWISSTSNTLFSPYSENDIIEFDFNIAGSADEIPMVMTYLDGVAEKPMVYNDSDKFTQTKGKEVPITIGSDECDVYIYRMKVYNKSLSDKSILQNYIADARSAEEILNRYTRNQLTDENGKLTPESVAEACPDLRIIKISAPHFTTSKKDFIKDTSVQCIYKNGDPVLDNWLFENGYHAGQGTTSDKYGASGRNIDIIMCLDGQTTINKKVALDPNYKSKLTLGDGTVYEDGTGKVTLTRESVPNNWFNIKVNVASSENANNALLQKRYNTYLPYTPVAMEDFIEVHKGTNTPVTKAEFKADNSIEVEMKHRSFVDMSNVKEVELHRVEKSYQKNSMEFVNCVVFIQESDANIDSHTEFNDTDWHFYAIGNLGDSKKTDRSRANDPTDLAEFCVEVSDNTLPNSVFPTGYTNEDGSIKYPISKEEWSGNNGYIAVTDENYLIAENLPIFYEKLDDGSYKLTEDTEIDSSKTYYEIDYKSKAYKSLYVDEYRMNGSSVQQVSGWDASFELRYADGGEIKDGSYTATNSSIKMQDALSKEAFRDFISFVVTSTDEGFKNNLKDYFIVDSALYYYLFTERYTMIDNRAKNCFYHYGKCSDGQYRFELWAYDMDSALGINNSGEAVFPYGLESTDVGYSLPNGTTSINPVFNAYNNVFWNRIREVFGKELQRIYQREESNKDGAFSATSLINQFDAWQNAFPEELWRLDVERKYIRPTLGTKRLNGEYFDGHKPEPRYLVEMMNGRKKYQRRQFERDQEKYMATKFCGLSAQNAHIMFRCSTPRDNIVVKPDYTLHIVPYADMYIDVEFGNTDPIQVRAKAGQTYDIPCTQEVMDDTAVIIYQGDNITSVGDLSSMYIHDNAFGVATHLTELKIGNEKKGYRNDGFVNLNLGENTLLKSLDIRNCAGLTGSLDLSKCENLEQLFAQGTNIAGVTFAPNGQIKEIHIPEIRSLVMKNLIYLTTLDTKGWSKLTSLVADNCGKDIDVMNIVQNAPNLTTVRLTGIDWNLIDASLLSRLYEMDGIDRNGKVINHSVVSGKVFVHTITQRDYNKFLSKWTDLSIKYETFIEQQSVLFRNARDENGNYETLAIEYWDIGTTPSDPTKANARDSYGNVRGENAIPYPTKASTERKNYSFIGWTPDFKAVVRGGDQIYTAKYRESPRLYTVVYVNRDNSILQETTNCPYGAYVPYIGKSGTYDTLKVSIPTDASEAEFHHSTLPTYTAGELGDNYYLFKGWDYSGYINGFHKKDGVDGDIVITAQYDNLMYIQDKETGRTPLENESGKIPFSEMTPVQIYAALQLHRKGAISLHGEKNSDFDWFALGDGINIQMGKDFNFTDVSSHEFVSPDAPLVLNGSNYFDSDNNETHAPFGKLLYEDIDFVFALEFSVNATKKDFNKVLLNMADNRNNGLKIFTTETQGVGVSWWDVTAPTNSTTGRTEDVAKANNRELLIVKHTKGSRVLQVYSANTAGSELFYTERQCPLNFASGVDCSLVLGAAKDSIEVDDSKKYNSFSTGIVYWAKVWYADFDDMICRDLASWTHETQTFQLAKSDAYYATNGESTSFQLLAKYLLPVRISMGTKVYSESNVHKYLNTRIFNAFPIQWQALMKSTHLESWDGMESYEKDEYGTSIGYRVKQSWTPFDAYLFIPCYYEVNNNAAAQYQRETGVNDRIKTIPMLASATELAGQWHPDHPNTANAPTYWTRSLTTETSYSYYYIDWSEGYGRIRDYYVYSSSTLAIRMMFSI